MRSHVYNKLLTIVDQFDDGADITFMPLQELTSLEAASLLQAQHQHDRAVNVGLDRPDFTVNLDGADLIR